MRDLFWLSDEQMARLEPYFPKSHGKPRVVDRRVLSGIIFLNRNGLRWPDAPSEYGPSMTLDNRWKRWGDMGVFARIILGLAQEEADPSAVMIDATYLKAHRTASSLGCLIPRFDGVILSREWKDALWDKFVPAAPRPRTPSEQQ